MSRHPRWPARLRSKVGQAVLGAGFWLLYRRGGWAYDRLATVLFGSAWQEWRAATVACLPAGRVLDLGCGTGAALDEIDRCDYEAVGLDRAPSMLRRARGPGRRLVRADAKQLPFNAGSFASCLSSFPAPYILDPLVHDEIARVLAPDGTLAVLVGGRPTSGLFGRLSGLQRGNQAADNAPPPLTPPPLVGNWRRLDTMSGVALVWIARRQVEAAWP